MAEKRRFLDVWIVESNTVYKEVPFEVVVDWVQQGRLLEDDMLKPSGTRDWFRLGGSPDFAPYLLRPEPGRAEDQAEALESIGEEFPVKRSRAEEEDDDVDMIPLIDVSLVLLVFFMLIGTGAAMASFANAPEAEFGQLIEANVKSMRIDITRDDDGNPIYALGIADQAPTEEERGFSTVAAVIDRLKVRLARSTLPNIEVVINADKRLPARVPRDVLMALRAEPFRSKVTANYFGVSGKRED
jgi:biopolymer transport protein ExbD